MDEILAQTLSNHRRNFGQHFTSQDIFSDFILPEIEDKLWDFLWVDLYAGEGNLILPILEKIPKVNRIDFFRDHIRIYDIQAECINKAIQNCLKYGIPKDLAYKNIQINDSLKNFPEELIQSPYPVYHITNPPYLYLGYIVKHPETHKYLQFFQSSDNRYQDLYQIAMMHDLKHKLDQMIYIIPTNFLFGNSVSNKIRDDFLPYYRITKAYIFEKRIFKYTGTNVIINFFKRKTSVDNVPQKFIGVKLGKQILEKSYNLDQINHYKAGNEFEEFVNLNKARIPVKLHYYLMQKLVNEHPGNISLSVIDANQFNGGKYEKKIIHVDSKLAKQIQGNILWIRTVDTGTWEGRAGLYIIEDTFQSAGILVTQNSYRTNPIQIFFEPLLKKEHQHLLLIYFNRVLELLRDQTDSEFLTTYKYSETNYIRKYFGLSQAKKIIATFPINDLSQEELIEFECCLKNQTDNSFLKFLNKSS